MAKLTTTSQEAFLSLALLLFRTIVHNGVKFLNSSDEECLLCMYSMWCAACVPSCTWGLWIYGEKMHCDGMIYCNYWSNYNWM